jgi:hypothetical protein
LGQDKQQVEGTRTYGHILAVYPQRALGWMDLEVAKAQRFVVGSARHGRNSQCCQVALMERVTGAACMLC